MLQKSTYIHPAYGRRYHTSAAALKDWNRGKDFKILRGAICTKEDYEALASQGNVYLVISARQHIDLKDHVCK